MNRIIAYQGEPGAFSEQAARKYFGHRAGLKPVPSFRDVFSLVTRGSVHAGIVPIENSVFGSIHQNYDLLLSHRLFVIGEIRIRIHLHLMALKGSSLRKIRSVYSQPQALGQCEDFLRSLKRVQVASFHDTAAAARMIRETKDTTLAAIASAQAAWTHGLRILKRNVESDHRNFTRFIVLSRTHVLATRKPKTSLVFAVRNIPGALFRALGVFALRDINLLKVESRPLLGKPWEYIFYVDVEGSPSQKPLSQALNHLKELCIFLRELDTYSQHPSIGY